MVSPTGHNGSFLVYRCASARPTIGPWNTGGGDDEALALGLLRRVGFHGCAAPYDVARCPKCLGPIVPPSVSQAVGRWLSRWSISNS